MSNNVYQMVTDRIIDQLQNGIIPWRKPWSGACLADGGAINYVSRKPYSMLNQLLLGKEGEWLTFKQVKDLGGSIKKGAKAGMVVFFARVKYDKKTVVDDEGNEETINTTKEYLVPILRYYNVFHIDDTTGIQTKIKAEEPAEPTIQPILVGHHSEGMHRAAIKKSWAAMDKSVEESKKAEAHESKAEYWERMADKIDLSMPESIEFFEHKLEVAKEYHEGLKSGKYPKQHSYSVTYANKAVREAESNLAIARKLWGE